MRREREALVFEVFLSLECDSSHASTFKTFSLFLHVSELERKELCVHAGGKGLILCREISDLTLKVWRS